MPRNRHTPEQVIRKLREAEVELAKGLTTYTRDRVPGQRIHRSAAREQRDPCAGHADSLRARAGR